MHQARLTGSELMDGGKGEEKAPRALAPPIQDMAAVIQAVALDGFPQPNRMPAVAFANEHAKHPGIGIVRHRQHSASEIAHHIGQIGVTARQHKGI
jgi:hypothetical protein